MGITNGYATEAELMSELVGTVVGSETPKNERAIMAASRMIDGYTGQRFWQDAGLIDRQYYPDSPTCVFLDDGISTTSGLVVKLDLNDDGTFSTTLTLNTDFIVAPINAADGYPIRPYTELRILSTGGQVFQRSWSGRPSIQVTAKFGWPAVPDAIKEACLFQASTFLKSAGAPGGILQMTGFDGVGMRMGKLHPQAAALCDDFVKVYA